MVNEVLPGEPICPLISPLACVICRGRVPLIELSRQTEALARRLADERDLSIDEIVRFALEASISGATSLPSGEVSPIDRASRQAAIDRAIAIVAALPELDGRSSKEIMDDLNSL